MRNVIERECVSAALSIPEYRALVDDETGESRVPAIERALIHIREQSLDLWYNDHLPARRRESLRRLLRWTLVALDLDGVE